MDNYVSGADVTRKALVDAALKLFGDRGYDAVSTRDIADHAAANIGSIAYHFGGKPGLRRAVAERVIATIISLSGPVLARPQVTLSAVEATRALDVMIGNFCRFIMAGEQGQQFLNFMLREIMQPGEILDQVYLNMFKPLHMRFCQLVAMATGLPPDSEEMKILVFSIIGQGIYFHLGRPIVLRRLEWDSLGQAEAAKIEKVLISNLHAILANARDRAKEKP